MGKNNSMVVAPDSPPALSMNQLSRPNCSTVCQPLSPNGRGSALALLASEITQNVRARQTTDCPPPSPNGRGSALALLASEITQNVRARQASEVVAAEMLETLS